MAFFILLLFYVTLVFIMLYMAQNLEIIFHSKAMQGSHVNIWGVDLRKNQISLENVNTVSISYLYMFYKEAKINYFCFSSMHKRSAITFWIRLFDMITVSVSFKRSESRKIKALFTHKTLMHTFPHRKNISMFSSVDTGFPFILPIHSWILFCFVLFYSILNEGFYFARQTFIYSSLFLSSHD